MRLYSSIAQPTTLSSSVSSTDTTVAVEDTVGYPTLTSGDSFTVALDAGGTTEELVDVTDVSGNVWTVTRGVDGTSAQSHSAGGAVRHSSSGRDFADAQTHINATTGVHGTTGALVGTTNTQTLSNKTLTSPTVNAGALAGTFTGTPEFSGAATFSGAPVFEGAAADDTAAAVRLADDTDPRLALQAGGTLAFGPGSADPDTTLSRSAAGTLAASGGLETGGDIAATGALGATVDDSATTAFKAEVSGDDAARIAVTGAGKIGWGTGAASRDTFLYRSGVGALKTDGDLTVAGDLAVSGIGTVLFAIKTSDTDRANTASPAPDPHLQLQLAANCTYVISGLLIWGGSQTGDIGVDFDGPSTTDGWWTTVNPDQGITNPTAAAHYLASGATEGRSYGWAPDNASRPFGMVITGILQTTSAVTYRLLWSQATADATATTVRAKSWLRAERVA